MKKHLLILGFAMMAMWQSAFAYDFSAVAPSGQPLYYKIIDSVNHYVKVTYPNDEQVSDEILNPWGWPINQAWDTYSRPTGILVIPDTVSYNGVVYTVRTIGAGAFCDCPYITSVVMPNTVDSIGKSAFLNCINLSNVTFSNALRYIGANSFMFCHLGDVVLPPLVQVVEELAMFNAHITSITLNDSIEKLGGACLEDNQFTSLYFPASVNSIGSIRLCFVNSIMVDPNNPYFDSRNSCNAVIKKANDELVISCRNTIIPESVEILGHGAFCGCGFETMLVPSSVIAIDASWEMHVNKLVLNSPIIGLDSYWWGQVDTIQLLTETPPIFLAQDINHDVRYDIPLIVPCNTLSAYQSADFWSDFTNMHEYEAPQIMVNAENGTATVLTYPTCTSDTATVSATADSNYHFVGWSDGSTQNPYTLVLTGNTTLTANFAIDSVLVRATPANPLKGAVMGGGMAPLNGTTTLTAIPTGNNIFLSWSNGVTDNPYTINTTSDTTLQAFFTLPDTLIFRDTINHYIHDTTFVNNNIHDTTILYVNQYVHDTTIVNNYVHDTTIMYVNQYVHDTTYINNNIHDTTILYVNQYVHDTTYINNNIHDTTILYVNQYVHDTTYINNYVHDTTIQYVNLYVHDTTYINNNIHDTTILYVNQYVHDTAIVNNYVHDTVKITTYVFDTTIFNHYVYDTTVNNLYQYDTALYNRYVYDTNIFNRSQYDTTIVNLYNYDTTVNNLYQYDTALYNRYVYDTSIFNRSQYDTTIVNLYNYDTTVNNLYQYDTALYNRYVYDTTIFNRSQYDTIIVNIYDTAINNYFYYDTVYVNNYQHDTTLRYVYDTVYLLRYLTDTVYIHDTVYVGGEGIDDIDVLNAKVYTSNGQIVVEGADGNMVTLYDVTGRVLANKRDDYSLLRFNVPVSGTYMVKIGNHPARKIVVVK